MNEKLSKDNVEISKNINKYDNLTKEIKELLTKYKGKPNLEPFYSKLDLEYKNNINKNEQMIISIQEKCQSIGIDILDEEDIKNNNYQRKDTLLQSIHIGRGKLMDRKNMLDQREKDLKEAQVIATQIKDVAQNINQKVHKDTEAFDVIEENVNILDKNVDNAVKDLKDVRDMQGNRRNKMCILSIIILIIVISFLCLLIGLYWENIKKIFNKN